VKKIKTEAPAKLNVFLDVKKPAGPDGFHEIVSLTGKISLSDSLTLEKCDGISLDMDSPWPLPRGRKNICVSAALAIRKQCPFPGVRIKLVKRIAPGQGMGGGSSDAAAVIKAIDRLWELRLTEKSKMAIAAGLGSDVPLFLMRSPFVWIRGRGEKLVPSRRKINGAVVLCFGRPLSTKKVYEHFDSLPGSSFRGADYRMPGRLVLYNALEEAAFSLRPELEAKKKKLLEAGAGRALMTGSGSTVFGIFNDPAAAKKFAAMETSCKIVRFL